MPQGLEVNDGGGNNLLTVTDRVTRILVVDSIPYADSFDKSYTFPEFLGNSPFVICSSFNVYTTVKDSVDVYLAGYGLPKLRTVWYQITWSISGSTLTLSGRKSSFYINGTFGTATIRTERISTPPFKIIIGVY